MAAGELMDLPCCLLCNSDTIRLWFVRRATDRDYTIVRCDSCRSAYVWPRPRDSTVRELYADTGYNPTHNNRGLYWPSAQRDAERLFKSFGQFISGQVFLDIGAGAGITSAEATRRGFTVRACEPSPQCRKEFADRNGFEPESDFFDSKFAERNRNQVDVVLLSHVLEHVPGPDQLMEDAAKVLRPEGKMIIAVPLFGSVLTAVMGKRDFFITPPEHLTYFSYAGLGRLLARHGFAVESMYTSSKVNMLRYRSLLGPIGYVVNMAAYSVLKFSELLDRSVVLNVCAGRIQ
jgi:2-polyprenyl-3-methyl-5-hydroxy-6-metoxy-1,4-benzoquinol methylase